MSVDLTRQATCTETAEDEGEIPCQYPQKAMKSYKESTKSETSNTNTYLETIQQKKWQIFFQSAFLYKTFGATFTVSGH